MINYLRHMAVFAKVVDEGSFRAAAKELRLSPSRVSETVSDLEQYLGVTLLYRSTRKLSLTDEGRRFYSHIADSIRSAETGLNELNVFSQERIGTLKISLPAFMAGSWISTAITEFASLNPKVSLSLIYTDQVVDMLREGIDLSIRVGWLTDSSMMSRKLGENRRLLVASKKYVSTRPTPTHPSDLEDWNWIRFNVWPNYIKFVSTSGKTVKLSANARITVNSADALRHVTSQNFGLTILPEHLVEDLISSGEFVHVLPEWQLESLGYYAVWLDKSRRENLTLHLVRFLAERNHTRQ